jgi:hypothetical protein
MTPPVGLGLTTATARAMSIEFPAYREKWNDPLNLLRKYDILQLVKASVWANAC